MTLKTRKAIIADAKRLHGQLAFAAVAPNTDFDEAKRLRRAKEELEWLIGELSREAPR